ncbi:c-type cytochrome [Vibrio sonorensis]|uniref:c-type cytochrome n=1 Tax=Vibrio sonorensis TaxID=1004316 RepID=UPI0008D998F8|nr:cytochrome c [Vibrio sonorensis]
MNRTTIYAILTSASLSATLPAQANFDNGKLNYQQLCMSCHGEKGQGNGKLAKTLSKPPSNMNQALSTWYTSDNDLELTVLSGEGTMPAWRSQLTPQDVKEIFAYLRTINLDKVILDNQNFSRQTLAKE